MVAVFNPQQDLKRLAACYMPTGEHDYYIGVLNTVKNTIAAIFCFDHYIENVCIDMHWAKVDGGAFLTRRTLGSLANYAFNFCKVNKVNAKIPIDNTKAISIATRAGFVHEGTLLKCAFNGNDLWCGGMFIKDCRWLNG